MGGRQFEVGAGCGVRRKEQCGRVPGLDHRSVDEVVIVGPVQEGQQAAVLITGLGVSAQTHDGAVGE